MQLKSVRLSVPHHERVFHAKLVELIADADKREREKAFEAGRCQKQLAFGFGVNNATGGWSVPSA
jgi:hypothetical protein